AVHAPVEAHTIHSGVAGVFEPVVAIQRRDDRKLSTLLGLDLLPSADAPEPLLDDVFEDCLVPRSSSSELRRRREPAASGSSAAGPASTVRWEEREPGPATARGHAPARGWKGR